MNKPKSKKIIIPAGEAYCGTYLIEYAGKHGGKLPPDVVIGVTDGDVTESSKPAE